MKVAVIYTILVLLQLTGCERQPEPLPTPLPTAKMVAAPPAIYLPAVIMSAPLVVDQRVGPEVCMAWSGQFLAEAQQDFGSQFYYHSATWRVPSVTAAPVRAAAKGKS